jgi:hypothetical protein
LLASGEYQGVAVVSLSESFFVRLTEEQAGPYRRLAQELGIKPVALMRQVLIEHGPALENALQIGLLAKRGDALGALEAAENLAGMVRAREGATRAELGQVRAAVVAASEEAS